MLRADCTALSKTARQACLHKQGYEKTYLRPGVHGVNEVYGGDERTIGEKYIKRFPVAMRLGVTPVLIPNTMVKT